MTGEDVMMAPRAVSSLLRQTSSPFVLSSAYTVADAWSPIRMVAGPIAGLVRAVDMALPLIDGSMMCHTTAPVPASSRQTEPPLSVT